MSTRFVGSLCAAIGLSAALAASAQSPAAGAPAPAPRPQIAWDLTPLYANDAAWTREHQALQSEVPRLRQLKGTLGKDAANLRKALDALSAAALRVDRLWTYAGVLQSTDNRDRGHQERMGRMMALYGDYASAIAWVDPEIQSLGARKVAAFVKADAGLQKHAERLRNTLRKARHTLKPETEAALAAFAPVFGAGSQARTLLVDADMAWPEIQVDGKPEKVSDTTYEKWRQHPDRRVRKAAMDAFFGQLGKFENTFGVTLNSAVQAGTIDARLRQHPSAAAASLAADDIPESVYRTLVAEANRGLPVLHRYFKLRQRMLKLPDLHYYDIYPPLVESGRSYPLADAKRLTQEATRPLGDEYQALLRQALAAPSMHVYPADGKSGGAYQTGVYGSLPYVFLNHQDDFDSVSTFAHEWGHGLHTLLANKNQPYETAGYPIFTAEIAAIVNEVLLSQHMLANAATREERLYQLGYALERIRGTFFRQAMFGEFELQTHDALQRGEALSGKRFTEIYCGLLRKYHGAEQGVMAIDPQYCQEWAFIPHFYRPFYVYQYATSISAAQFFADQILAGHPKARETYLDVLRAGGSQPPYQLLKKAGLDMATPVPYAAVVERMNRIIDEMERLLDGRS